MLKKTDRFYCGILILGFLLALVGCTTLDANLPAPEVQSPEITPDRHRFEIGGGITPVHEVTLASISEFSPPDLQTYNHQSTFDAYANGGFAVFKHFEVGAQVAPITSTGIVNLKWQFLGDNGNSSDSESSTTQPFLAAIYTRVGLGYNSVGHDQAYDTSDSGDYGGTSTLAIAGAGISLGYRLPSSCLLFAGAAVDNYQAWTHVYQHANASSSNNYGEYGKKDIGHGLTIAGGFKWGQKFNVELSGGYTHQVFTDIPNVNDIHLRTAVGYAFN